MTTKTLSPTTRHQTELRRHQVVLLMYFRQQLVRSCPFLLQDSRDSEALRRHVRRGIQAVQVTYRKSVTELADTLPLSPDQISTALRTWEAGLGSSVPQITVRPLAAPDLYEITCDAPLPGAKEAA